MIYSLGDKKLNRDNTDFWVAPSASVIGAITLQNNASVWFELKTVQKINLGTHTFFIGEIIDCKTHNPDERVAYMGDTRMKYGGVPRGGH